ncbi:MAG TPA: class E sortase, partial [Acidimicrobiales bacterium]
RLADRIVAEQGDRTTGLTDHEWMLLCSAARGAKDTQSAITRVIVEANRLGSVTQATTAGRQTVEEEVSPPWNLLPIPADFAVASSFAWGLLPLPADFAVAPSAASDLLPIPAGFGSAPARIDPAKPGTAAAASVLVVGPDEAVQRNHRRHRVRRAKASTRVRTLDDRTRERWLTAASWVRNIGAIILLFVAWQLWGTAITQHHNQTTLKNQFEAHMAHPIAPPPPGFTLASASTQLADPPEGTVMAELQIPKIGLTQYVVSGTSTDDLNKGPGHYLHTALPGQAGNVAIAGHRTTHGAPFNRLAELSPGDPIYLITTAGQRLTYVVSAAPVAVSPSNVTVLNNFGDDRVTLTTCNPEFSAVQRLIIVAAYQPPGASHPDAIAKVGGKSYKLAPSDSSSWNTGLLPWVLLVGAALVALGLAHRRLARAYGRDGRWLVLVPIWIALLLAFFELLTNFLPAAV